jgi:hypothetical protein
MPCGHEALPVQAWTSFTTPISPDQKIVRGYPRRIMGVTLIPHLGGDLILLRRARQQARFPGGPRQRFLDVDVLPELHAPQGGGGVHVVWSPDDHRVDALPLFVEHLPEVLILLGLPPSSEPWLAAFPIDIRQRHDVLRLAVAQIAERLAARADAGEVQFFVGRFVSELLERWRAAEPTGRYGPRQKRSEEEVPSRYAVP